MVEPSTLDARVAKLGKASQRAALVSSLGLLIVLGALGYASWQLHDLERQKAKSETEKAKLDTQIQEMDTQIQEKRGELEELGAWKDGLAVVNEKLSATAIAANPNVEADVRVAENAKYAVGLYGFAVSNEAFEHVRSALQADGYIISQQSLLDDRPSWLSPRSTVLYYDKERREKALNIATELSKVAGAEFVVATGHGLGVIPGQERWTFFVHYVGK